MQFFKKIDPLNRLLIRITEVGDIQSVKQLHGHLLRTNLLFVSINLQTELIFAYKVTSSKFGANPSQILLKLFNSVDCQHELPFGILIRQFYLNGFHDSALETLSFMHFRGFRLDSYALCHGLTACSIVKESGFGEQIYCHVLKSGWFSSVFVGSAVVGLYARTLLVDDAEKVFDEMPERNSVCANTLFCGYGEAKMWTNGIGLFRKMPGLGLDYDRFTFTAVLRACAGLSAVDLGRQLHAYILRSAMDLKSDVCLRSSLIDMYGKCGLLSKAWQVFDLTWLQGGQNQNRDIVLWTSILSAYGRNGCYMDVLRLYKEMLSDGIRPDGVSFLSVLSACAHTGQVKLGLECFESMVNGFGLKPGPEHYSCVVDLLCRAGELEKAWNLVNEVPLEEQSVSLWGALLGACKDCGNVILGRLVAKKALELDPFNAGIYFLLANLYVKFDMREEIQQLDNLMKQRGLKKETGCSWIELTH